MLTACVGREAERAQLAAQLAVGRCVAVVGPPGCGKSLLAQHVASDVRSAVWVDAGLLTEVDHVVGACLTALGVELVPGDAPREALSRALDGTDAVLVVDGLGEVDGVAAALGGILDETTSWRCLVTAYAPLGVPGERVVRLGALSLPSPHEPLRGPAVDLCLERVVAAGGAPIDPTADGPTLRRLLQATGGLPLLIEQLAVQVALVGLANAIPSASLAEALGATYSLLDEDQRRCFRRLAQLTAPAGLDVLVEVAELDRPRAGAVIEALARRSLVHVGSDGRFGMLAPIRSYGRGLAVGTGDAERATAGLLRWAESVLPTNPLVGAADEVWLADLPLIRSAITAACARPESRHQGYSLANRAFPALYTAMRYREASEILEGVIASGDGPADIGAQVAPAGGDRHVGGQGDLRGVGAPRPRRGAGGHLAQPGPGVCAQPVDPRGDAPRRR